MKLKITTILLLALLSSCGREGLKEDITLPELPPSEESIIKVLRPASSDVYLSDNKAERENIMYIKWKGLSLEDTVRMDLYRSEDFIAILQTRPGVDSTICRIPDSLITSSHYRVKVYKRSSPGIYGFSDEFTIKGLPDGDSISVPQSK